MGSKNIVCMNAGNGKTSYANNSSLQNVVISETWDLVDEALRDMSENGGLSVNCYNMVDFGCASGPNALSVVSHVRDTIHELCKNIDDSSTKPQEIQCFLNDLPDNDFNSVFKSVEKFMNDEQLVPESKARCFIYGLPGSFYRRLFPTKSLHFGFSSFSLHWLSQVPQGLGSKNKENICMAMTSPPEVFEAYAEQYKRDISTFLSSRGEEMVAGGRLVLTFIGRSVEDPYSRDETPQFNMLSHALVDMVNQGLLNKDDLYSFNMPIYMPCRQEVEWIVKHEGSFKIDKFVGYPVLWDANDVVRADELHFGGNRSSGKLVTDCIRAFMEQMLVSHFQELINCDVLFERYAQKMDEHLSKERSSLHVLSISLIKT